MLQRPRKADLPLGDLQLAASFASHAVEDKGPIPSCTGVRALILSGTSGQNVQLCSLGLATHRSRMHSVTTILSIVVRMRESEAQNQPPSMPPQPSSQVGSNGNRPNGSVLVSSIRLDNHKPNCRLHHQKKGAPPDLAPNRRRRRSAENHCNRLGRSLAAAPASLYCSIQPLSERNSSAGLSRVASSSFVARHLLTLRQFLTLALFADISEASS